ERPHIAAGFSSVVHREVWLNPEHPPPVKLLAGAALFAAGGEEGPAGGHWSRAHQNAQCRAEAQRWYGALVIYRAHEHRPVPATPGPRRPFGEGTVAGRAKWLAFAAAFAAVVAYLVLWACYLGAEPIEAYRHGMSSIYHNRDPNLLRVCLGYYGKYFWWYFPV